MTRVDTSAPTTLVDVLRRHAGEVPDRVAFRFPAKRGRDEQTLTYRELHDRAALLAAGLRRRVSPGDRVLLAFVEPAEFVPSLFACLYAGVVAVPTPLGETAVAAVAAHQTEGIARDAGPSLGLTSSMDLVEGGPAARDFPRLRSVPWSTADALATGGDGHVPDALDRSGPAVLQYTSGSTSAPKGVMVSHGNIVDQVRRIQRAFHLSWDSVLPSWLPLYHDMGLVATVLAPVYAGAEAVLIAPGDFIRDPLRWLRLVTEHRGTVCGAPNFAYDLCARRATPEALSALDLRSWRLAWNGAEPIVAETLERFAKTFEPAGFRGDAFYPCFGMAETTLMVTGRQGPVVRRFVRNGLEQGRATDADDAGSGTLLVSSGRADHGQDVRIVDPETSAERADGTVGEVWVSGPSVAAGYWRRPALSEETFCARVAGPDGDRGDERGYLRTGDAGFLLDGELFISGRLKDLIIVRGRNVFPQDLELTVERCDPALRQGRGAAFGIPGEAGVEEIVVVYEVRDLAAVPDVPGLTRRIRDALGRDHGLVAGAVVLIGSGALPKTSSGKVQRLACRAAYLDGTLPVLVEDRLRGGAR